MAIERIGIVGAGTMGAGIALTALYADMDVILYDLYPEMLEKAQGYIEKFLKKRDMADRIGKLTLSEELGAMAKAEVVIEAALEDLAVKQEIFAQLDAICNEEAILATNTSTIAVTSIAADTAHPQRVAGMHFFNPAPLMQLVEVIKASQSSHATIETLVKLAKQLDKTPVICKDSPGFIVNRVARPYYLEAMRIASEGIATFEQIDTVMQLGGGFRMGPFRLMDLIGIDISLAASTSIYQQTFNEPRFRPSLIQAQMVQAKTLGRKTGKGFYDYSDNASEFTLPDIPEKERQKGRVNSRIANGLAARCRDIGYTVATAVRDARFWIADTESELAGVPSPSVIVFTNAGTISQRRVQRKFATRIVPTIGYDDFLLESAQLVTLVNNPSFRESEIEEVEAFFRFCTWDWLLCG
ncbi:MAG: 3-hydroxyacyl-CoA dehydrogenase NAD-binding domain-containing protein [Anaerolineae bacterium]|nr:3-hydroxyacyl-CoA dehydrogenase NAD-binding domain-containing protein [Anaerolineae bacterium]